MKILMLATGMGLGGAETQICALSARLIDLGHEVHIAWLTGDAGLALPAKAITHPLNIYKTPIGFTRAITRLRKLTHTIEPDVIHAHMVHANLIARLTRLTNRHKNGLHQPRLICTAHSSHEGGRLLMLGYRFTDSLTDLTTHVSQQAANTFIDKGAIGKDRILVVPNGVDTDRFKPDNTAYRNVRQTLGLNKKVPLERIGFWLCQMVWIPTDSSLITRRTETSARRLA